MHLHIFYLHGSPDYHKKDIQAYRLGWYPATSRMTWTRSLAHAGCDWILPCSLALAAVLKNEVIISRPFVSINPLLYSQSAQVLLWYPESENSQHFFFLYYSFIFSLEARLNHRQHTQWRLKLHRTQLPSDNITLKRGEKIQSTELS